MDLLANGYIPSKHNVIFMSKSKQHPIINIRDNVERLGTRKSQALIGLHNYTGADWGGKMVGLSKATWIKRFLSLDDSDAIITSLIRLGEGNIIKNLVDGQLPSDLRPLEKFTCNAYSNTPSSPDNIPDLRLHLFRTKNYGGENLPPT